VTVREFITGPLRPNGVRAFGIATIIAMVPLVALGGQTTTRSAGMADPVWPTEPWYLVVNSHEILKEPRPGFLLEHTHRLAGWITGFLALGFAFAAWWNEPNRSLKAGGFASLLALIVAYGGFHGAMRLIKDDPTAFGNAQLLTGIASLILAMAAIGFCVISARSGQPGGMTRALATIGLIGVMIQGLLGGFRVLLNYWFGPDLAIVHGCFAHVVVCTYVAAVMTAAPVSSDSILSPDDRQRLGRWVLAAIALVFLQLIWGALTRHTGTALAQRLHLLTAFAATAIVLVIAFRIFSVESVNRQLRGKAIHLIGIVFVQVALGVEAYIGKFAAVGPYANLEPRFRPITDGQALTRTAHVLVGLTLLASLVALAVRVYRTRATNEFVKQTELGTVRRSESEVPDPAAV
jgi:cytochrome c oxidase assembly protein subunit 15